MPDRTPSPILSRRRVTAVDRMVAVLLSSALEDRRAMRLGSAPSGPGIKCGLAAQQRTSETRVFSPVDMRLSSLLAVVTACIVPSMAAPASGTHDIAARALPSVISAATARTRLAARRPFNHRSS